MDAEGLRRLGRAALPGIAALSLVAGVGATLAVAGATLGYDFLAYHQAATRLLDGQPVYDMSFTETGGFGLFYYPPTFVPIVLPFGLLPPGPATWLFIALSLAAAVVGIWILPVSRAVRWTILLLAGLSFPFVYALKLGQVGPLLLFGFAVGWRWLDDPVRLGASAALGTAIKLQPGLILVWAVLTRRWRAAMVGFVVLAALASIALLFAGLQPWSDFLTLLGAVADPVATERNLTPGAIAYQAGVARELAAILQLMATVLVTGVLLVSVRLATDEASYLTAVIASQLVSPILWDHYAMLLLLPTAYLLAAGRWWAVVLPLATAWPLVGITPPVAYPATLAIALLAVVWVGRRQRRVPEPRS
jgi:alpha-1,2-mannosyltransferase